MASSTARIILKRGSAVLFGSSSSRQQPRLSFHSFSERAVDTLALVKRLEAQGIPSRHAEVITSVITEDLNDTLENVAQSFVSNEEMQKSEMTQVASLSEFKTEVQSSQEHHFSLLQREIEKFRGDIENMRSETTDIEKLRRETLAEIAKTRSELRNEICENDSLVLEEIRALRNEACRDKSLVLQEIQAYRAQEEAATDQAKKFYFGALVSIFVAELVIIRLM